ncbi:SCP-like protein, partial [Ancylostoma caninum]
AVVPDVLVTVEATTRFNCRNSLISDEWRQYVLDELNDYRRSLARGEVYDATKNFLPKAKDMNELKWDCNLEEVAYKSLQSLMSTCDVPLFSISRPYQTMQKRFKRKECNITSQAKVLLYGWWKEIKNTTVKYVNGNPSVPTGLEFIVMATATTTGFACTYEFCNNMPRGIIACIYDDKTTDVSVANRIIYQATQNTQEICSSCSKNCIKSLCNVPHTPVTLPTTCSDDKLTQDSNNAALWMHNYYRKLLASGWAKDKKSKSGYALTAKKMLKLEYDCAPAAGGISNGATKTYDLIKDCPKSGNPTPSNGYSMNFLRLKNHTISEQEALEQAIKKWWGVLETKGLGSENTFSDNSEIASFAKMAHDGTEKLACAVQNCKQNGETLVACQYSPAIQDGDKIYETGKVCGGCKALSKKCSDPAGLCE